MLTTCIPGLSTVEGAAALVLARRAAASETGTLETATGGTVSGVAVPEGVATPPAAAAAALCAAAPGSLDAWWPIVVLWRFLVQ